MILMSAIALIGMISLWNDRNIGYMSTTDKLSLCVIVFTFLSFIPALILGEFIGDWETHNRKIEIYSLQDNMTPDGVMFLGTGSIQGKTIYSYYRKEGAGYKLGYVSTSNAVVKQLEEDVQPYIEVHQEKCKDTPFSGLLYLCAPGKETYTIYVPNGSIKRDYNLDARL